METNISVKPSYLLIEYPEIVTLAELMEVVAYFETQIDNSAKQLNRLHDISKATSNLVGYKELQPLAKRRKTAPPNHPKKIAYVVKNELQFGMVRMWQMLMDYSQEQLKTFYSYEEAEEYLLQE